MKKLFALLILFTFIACDDDTTSNNNPTSQGYKNNLGMSCDLDIYTFYNFEYSPVDSVWKDIPSKNKFEWKDGKLLSSSWTNSKTEYIYNSDNLLSELKKTDDNKVSYTFYEYDKTKRIISTYQESISPDMLIGKLYYNSDNYLIKTADITSDKTTDYTYSSNNILLKRIRATARRTYISEFSNYNNKPYFDHEDIMHTLIGVKTFTNFPLTIKYTEISNITENGKVISDTTVHIQNNNSSNLDYNSRGYITTIYSDSTKQRLSSEYSYNCK